MLMSSFSCAGGEGEKLTSCGSSSKHDVQDGLSKKISRVDHISVHGKILDIIEENFENIPKILHRTLLKVYSEINWGKINVFPTIFSRNIFQFYAVIWVFGS